MVLIANLSRLVNRNIEILQIFHEKNRAWIERISEENLVYSCKRSKFVLVVIQKLLTYTSYEVYKGWKTFENTFHKFERVPSSCQAKPNKSCIVSFIWKGKKKAVLLVLGQ